MTVSTLLSTTLCPPCGWGAIIIDVMQGVQKKGTLRKIVITSKPQRKGQWNKHQSTDNTST